MTIDYSDLSSFPSHWEIKTIKEFAKIKGGKRLPLGKSLTPNKTTHPYIRIVDFKDGRVDKSNLLYVPEDVFPCISRYTISKDDIYISIVGTIGLVGLIDPELNKANLTENAAKICEIDASVDRKFLAAYLQSGYGQHEIMTQTVGSTQPKLALFRIGNIRVPLPPLPEQRAIAGILGALDDKIELNRRMNRTLESMARAVFREWFVENEEAEGWEVGTLGDVVVNFDSKRVPLSKREREQRQGKYPYYGAASIMDYVDDYLFDGIYVLMAEDGSVVGDEDHPVLQYVWGRFWVNNHAHVLQGTNGICNEHLYLFLKDVNILPYVTGAVQPKLNQANMNSIPFVIPPKELSKKFEEFASPLFAKIRANEEESRTLARLRDALLPKLMSGEVRVKP